MEQMNLSKPDKDSEDYIKNVAPSSTTLAVGFDIWRDERKARFKCLNLAMREGEYIRKYTAIVNRMCNALSNSLPKEDQFRVSLSTRIWLKAMKLGHVKSRNPKSTDRPRITRCRSRSLRDSTRIPITPLIINRGADFVVIFTSIKTVLSINISARTVLRTDTRKDSVRTVRPQSKPPSESASLSGMTMICTTWRPERAFNFSNDADELIMILPELDGIFSRLLVHLSTKTDW
ncbi:unnamed protein product [Hymenolepis diminuta]|uniref:Uncharacterized protein n=1 Tax=Hymenolepis diminuta TaxID=6216 RepID=A0A564YXA7_HYMDI|nr:unnamed protein product [Hymenolepis diminuta]